MIYPDKKTQRNIQKYINLYIRIRIITIPPNMEKRRIHGFAHIKTESTIQKENAKHVIYLNIIKYKIINSRLKKQEEI